LVQQIALEKLPVKHSDSGDWNRLPSVLVLFQVENAIWKAETPMFPNLGPSLQGYSPRFYLEIPLLSTQNLWKIQGAANTVAFLAASHLPLIEDDVFDDILSFKRLPK
jgi:hypothetical protein